MLRTVYDSRTKPAPPVKVTRNSDVHHISSTQKFLKKAQLRKGPMLLSKSVRKTHGVQLTVDAIMLRLWKKNPAIVVYFESHDRRKFSKSQLATKNYLPENE